MVVAPPSIHPSGGRYQWVAIGEPPGTLAALPRWLINLIRLKRSGDAHGAGYWKELAAKGVEEGERNNTIASFAGHLFWRGVDPDVIRQLLLCWNRVRAKPPLEDAEVIRTIDSIQKTHESRHR